jgi:hypothetical protein
LCAEKLLADDDTAQSIMCGGTGITDH